MNIPKSLLRVHLSTGRVLRAFFCLALVLTLGFASANTASAQAISETFSTSPASNFTVVSGGTWAVTGGQYVLTSPAQGTSSGANANISTHNTSLSGDWTLTVDGSTTATSSAWNDFTVMFGYQDANNYYYVSFNESNDDGTSGIFKWVAGVKTQLADITTLITGGTTYAVKVEKTGTTYKAYLNNTLVATATDSTFSSGKVGFGTNNDGASYDNLIVTLVGGGGTVAAPSYSPVAGTYTSVQSVTITSATSGATIRYTTNGTNPTSTTGTVYSGPVSIGVTTTLKAIAYKSGMTDSSVTSGVYTINLPPVATPSFSPPAGTYTSIQSVTISSATSGATIRYTTNGTDPTSTTGTVYSSPVSITATTTLKAIAYKSGMTDSTVTSGTYTLNLPVAAPTFSPGPGTYTSAQSVTISSSTSGATIRYTTNGATPSTTVGTVYSAPVSIAETATLKAIAYKSGMTDSTVTSGLYTISVSGTVGLRGPTGEWPARTPRLADVPVANRIEVDCNWTAIKSALDSITTAQANAGAAVLIRPGNLPGNGASSGSTPVLSDVTRKSTTLNVLVMPRDGWETVAIAQDSRMLRVKGVTFARINASYFRFTDCSYSIYAQSVVTNGAMMTATGEDVVQNDFHEVVFKSPRTSDNDPIGYAAGANRSIRDCTWTGCYFMPMFRAAGSTNHVDTMQMYGNGWYRGLTIRDSVLLGSNNCALQLGGSPTGDPFAGTPYLTLDNVYVMSCTHYINSGVYPVPSGIEVPSGDQVINGNGDPANIRAYDSVVIGTIYPSGGPGNPAVPWAEISNSIASNASSTTRAPAVIGGWTVQTNAFDTIPKPPVPTDEYLLSIWDN